MKRRRSYSSSDSNQIPKKTMKREIVLMDQLFESDDEVILLECPLKFNVQSLVNNRISGGGKFVNKVTKEKYVVDFHPKYDSLHCVSASIQGHQLNTVSHYTRMSLVRKVHVKDAGEIEDVNYLVPLPSMLRLRHPLLGNNFMEHISKVKRRLKKVSKGMKKKSKSIKVETS